MTARRAAVLGLAIAFAGCGGGAYYDGDDSLGAAGLAADEATTTTEEAVALDIATASKAPAEFVKALPANPRSITDGLVRSRDWKALGWANPATVSPWKKQMSGDDVVLVVTLDGGKGDKSAISRPVSIAADAGGELRMDVYNAGPDEVKIAFAVFASVDRVYSESIVKMLAPGWNRVVFDLSASTFKTATSEWKNSARLWGPGDVREIAILFYHDRPVALAIDGIEVDGKITETD